MLTVALIALNIVVGIIALIASIGGTMGFAGLGENRQRNPHDFNWAVCLILGVPSVALALCPLISIVVFVYSWLEFRAGQTGTAFLLSAIPLLLIVTAFGVIVVGSLLLGLFQLITTGIRERLQRWRRRSDA